MRHCKNNSRKEALFRISFPFSAGEGLEAHYSVENFFELMMDVIRSNFKEVTNVVRNFLDLLDIKPEYYRFLFPAGKDAVTIKLLVDEGVFPVISSLAPALSYAILFSAIRFIMSRAFFKVIASNNSLHLRIHFKLRRICHT